MTDEERAHLDERLRRLDIAQRYLDRALWFLAGALCGALTVLALWRWP